jgi:AraC family transcriptional regulator
MAVAARDPRRPLSTRALARRSGWSEAHLHRAFRAVAQETPKSWTTRLRLAHALALLRGSDATVAEIAERTGFGSHEVMTRAFRRELGSAPTALRSGPPELATPAACLCLYHVSLDPPRRKPVPTDPISVVTRDPQPTLVIRRRVPPEGLQPALAEILPAVYRLCQQRGYALTGAPFTRYLEMSRGHFTIEAGFPAAGDLAGDGAIVVSELPGGEVATAVHRGPYDTLGEAHTALEAYAAERGRAAGAAWESYVTDPGDHPNPADWRTEVYLPLG